MLRWGAGRPITGRSACDGCGRILSPLQLLPLLGWLLAAGRCTSCGGRIDPFHPLTELVFAFVGATCLYWMPNAAGAALLLFAWLLLTLALFDARLFWLPHGISLTTALLGLLLGGLAMAGVGLTVPLSDRLIGAATGFASLWLIGRAYRLLRQREGLGGGDAPMFAAIGAWTGWQLLPMVLLFAALAGLAVATARLLSTSGSHSSTQAQLDWRSMRLPLGTLMALAVGPALWVMARLTTG